MKKYIFLITSCLHTTQGMFTIDQRLRQTLNTINSICRLDRSKEIILVDSSDVDISEISDTFNVINSYFPMVHIHHITGANTHKSVGEAQIMEYALKFTLDGLKEPKENYSRIFKISGRYTLSEGFDISYYDNVDEKYVFCDRITYRPDGLFMFQTVLYSIPMKLLDDYISILPDVIKDVCTGLDLEHSIFRNINKDLVIEIPIIGFEGFPAPHGKYIKT